MKTLFPAFVPAWMQDFLRFGIVGCAGFIANTIVVYALRPLIGLYAAGAGAWVCAATCTWWLNRSWTFKGRGSGTLLQQWAKFLGANLTGGILYYIVFALLIAHFPLCARQPVIAVAAGVLAGMVCNFTLSRKLVFR